MLASLSGSVVWWWSSNVYACGCLLSVTCQVAMVNSYGTLKELCPYIRLKIDSGHFDGLVFFVHPECPR